MRADGEEVATAKASQERFFFFSAQRTQFSPAPLPYQFSINSTLEITSWFDFSLSSWR
jgi:hypothetical protein